MLFVPADEVVLHQCTCQQSVPEMEVDDSSGKDDCYGIRSLQTVGIGKKPKPKYASATTFETRAKADVNSRRTRIRSVIRLPVMRRQDRESTEVN